jgi:hypothetical protein
MVLVVIVVVVVRGHGMVFIRGMVFRVFFDGFIGVEECFFFVVVFIDVGSVRWVLMVG